MSYGNFGIGLGKTPAKPSTPPPPPPPRLEDLLAANTAATRDLERAIREMSKKPPTDIRPTGVAVPEKSPYEAENITGGTLTLTTTAILATPIAADCRWWKYISAVITCSINFANGYPIYVQFKANSGPSPTGDVSILATLEVTINSTLILNIAEEDWAPFIYADIYAPGASSTYPYKVRIDIIKRGLI